MKSETAYQRDLMQEIKIRLPGCIVLKNNPAEVQGIPDLIVLYKDHWAMLEVKQHARARARPNQDYYVGLLDSMSFSAFIYPENEDEVLNALQSTFGA